MAGLLVHSCNQAPDQYTINLELDGTEGKWVYLMALEEREYIVYDSVLAERGMDAVLSKSVPGVKTMYLTIEGSRESIMLLVENADYTISGTIDNPVIKSSGEAQGDLNNYNEELKEITTKMVDLRSALQEAFGGNDVAEIDSLREEYYKLYELKDAYDSVYIAGNPASFATVLALRNTFFKLDAGQLEDALGALDQKLQHTKEYSYMYGKLERMKAVAVGQPYADFGLETPKGKMLKVSDIHNGNVLLIDFWASWCGPCRNTNPELVQIYKDYHEKGFEILGVSLDRDSASWIKAIADDKLTWPQISDLKFWKCEGAELYGVPAIPHAVLIDRNGIIRAKKLHGDRLREAIESIL